MLDHAAKNLCLVQYHAKESTMITITIYQYNQKLLHLIKKIIVKMNIKWAYAAEAMLITCNIWVQIESLSVHFSSVRLISLQWGSFNILGPIFTPKWFLNPAAFSELFYQVERIEPILMANFKLLDDPQLTPRPEVNNQNPKILN